MIRKDMMKSCTNWINQKNNKSRLVKKKKFHNLLLNKLKVEFLGFMELSEL